MICSSFCLCLVTRAPVICAVQHFISYFFAIERYHSQHVSDRVDTLRVVQLVASLFHGHPYLIQGFDTFLPIGHCIEVSSDAVIRSHRRYLHGPYYNQSRAPVSPAIDFGNLRRVVVLHEIY